MLRGSNWLVRLLAAKKLLVTYSASIDDLIILATVLSSSSSRDGGCLDFLEEDICCVDEKHESQEALWGRNEIPVMYAPHRPHRWPY
jgi:hypothetical protein